MLEPFIAIFHGVNAFLGTPMGELVKSGVEFLFFILISYMLASEWLRERVDEYRLLLFGFLALAMDSLLLSVSYAWVLFKGVPWQVFLATPIPVLDALLELAGLVLVAGAFIRMLAPRAHSIRTVLIGEAITLAILYPVFVAVWMLSAGTHDIVLLILGVLKIVAIAWPVVMLVHAESTRYRGSVIAALLVYLIAPVIDFINLVRYGGGHSSLSVLAHPFPLIAVLLLARVVYLRLADKAFLKEQVSQAEQRARQEHEVARLKDKFLSTVTHELKTPLTSIRLYADLIERNAYGVTTGEQRHAAHIIKSESKRLTTLVDDVLTLSKLEAGGMRLRTRNVNVHGLIASCPLNIAVDQAGVRLVNDTPETLVVQADEQKLVQIHTNLLGNALKFTPKGGIITIRARRTRTGWKYMIKDTGEGIPQEKLPGLFTKFYQAEEHLTREKGGTGLGLSIVKELVELHGGSIGVASRLEKGTTVSIEFPRKPKAQSI